MFAIVKRYYDRGIYNEKAVARFVSANMLTAEEYKHHKKGIVAKFCD